MDLVRGLRRDVSTAGFALAILASLFSLSSLGVILVWVVIGLALLAFALYPTLPRFLLSLNLLAFNRFAYVGLAVALLVSVAVVLWRHRKRRSVAPSQD